MHNILKTLLSNNSRILGSGFRNSVFYLILFLFFYSNNIFAQDEYDYPLIKKDVDSIKKAESKYWYADKSLEEFEKMEKEKEKKEFKKNERNSHQQRVEYKEEVSEGSPIISMIMWLILGGAIIFAIYLILKNLKDFRFNFNKKVEIESTSAIIEEENITAQNLNQVSFQSQIEKCIQEGNYRLAIRYYYLWIVKNLNEANLIEFNIDKTNFDYLKELKTKNSFASEKLAQFKNCTLFYEYVWFGNFDLKEPVFLKIENSFKDFIGQKL
jgi:hypothetical protein